MYRIDANCARAWKQTHVARSTYCGNAMTDWNCSAVRGNWGWKPPNTKTITTGFFSICSVLVMKKKNNNSYLQKQSKKYTDFTLHLMLSAFGYQLCQSPKWVEKKHQRIIYRSQAKKKKEKEREYCISHWLDTLPTVVHDLIFWCSGLRWPCGWWDLNPWITRRPHRPRPVEGKSAARRSAASHRIPTPPPSSGLHLPTPPPPPPASPADYRYHYNGRPGRLAAVTFNLPWPDIYTR